ncbi:hypothetical protein [Spirosoma flavum]|uniref:Uncharacterized protein n=1 Tax=Spirosoma flavum TaxID=2048557 RepID=A0ABW6AFK5_9BACT
MHWSINFHRFLQTPIWLLACALLTASHPVPQRDIPPAATFSSQVVTSWLTLQLQLTQTTPAPPPFTVRRFAYTGIALYESVVPGLASYQSMATQLNGLPPLPKPAARLNYYWPACANAAMATMSRYFHPMTSALPPTKPPSTR